MALLCFLWMYILSGLVIGQPCSSDWDCPSSDYLCVVNSEPEVMNFRIDDNVDIWADGIHQGTFSSWINQFSLTVQPWTQVLSFEACNTILWAGILASFSNGMISDSDWRCVEEEPTGRWKQPYYDDSTWPAAVEQGLNGIQPWGNIADVSSSAYWIWTSDSPIRYDCIYCRVKLGRCIRGAECHSDCDCPDGTFCHEGRCVECVTYRDCPRNHYCRNSECIPWCTGRICDDVKPEAIDAVETWN